MDIGWTLSFGVIAKLAKSTWLLSHLHAGKALGLLTCAASCLRETPDVVSSSDAYAARFTGASGQWMLSVQNRALLSLLQPFAGASVLDVGGGHGQYSRELVAAGHRLTVLGSSAECAHRIRDLVESGQCQFLEGNVLSLPLEDRARDVVISFRQLAHLSDWRAFLRELTRVSAKSVILDFPPSRSFNALLPVLFPLKRALENGSTRRFVSFDEAEVRRELEANGFRVTGRVAEFGLPMVVHRKLRLVRLSRLLEDVARVVGWTRRFGSPLVLRAERIG